MQGVKAHDIASGRDFVELPRLAGDFTTYVKLEGLNPTGSIKLKAAREMVKRAEANGCIGPDTEIIESTSGNLGIALASICAAKGYRITLVTDPNANPRTIKYIRALGANLITVQERDGSGGYLQTRLDYIQSRLAADSRLLWLNQYANPANPEAHRTHTAREIFDGFGVPDWLFVGAGTSGTLMGCLQHISEHQLPTRLVAVDAVGSVLFGGPPGRRFIPGLGASRRPELLVDDGSYDKVHVPESETIRMCRRVAREHGLLLGGSSGTVLAAVAACRNRIARTETVVAISPDMGDGYLDTIYDDLWVVERFGVSVLTPSFETEADSLARQLQE